MHRLPTKTTAPIRMRSKGHQPEGNGYASREAQSAPVEKGELPIPIPPLKLLRFPAIRERTGLSRSTIWRLERDGNFPKHHRISLNAVAWVEEEVMHWIRSKIQNVAV